ncbi:hypothetical protein HM1_0311 [Heliomicrobium modesticaldum Ice1]|uniref:Uncharacterized protein n=1 Tax=Heliobacterium modesticaldum (strain ATCC 51547 / Ice1) TaxID=498761 RepID=B0TEL1_HELMI|nr:hypothetical protein [Heliomicrobium modesticaldum]ABZ82930.1 hypothetical protein HM1_0311 [Heliomicrobium modesticaldum Ice1]
MARRRYIVARSMTNTDAATTAATHKAQFVEGLQQNLPDYGKPTMTGAERGLYGSIRPTWEIYPGE